MTALIRTAAALAVVLGVAVASPASAGPPTDALSGYVDRLFAVLDDPKLKEPGRAVERHRTIRTVAEDALDFRESARRALGTHREPRTEVERDRFVRLFTDLIDHAYLTRINLDGERVVLDSETVNGTEASVKGRAQFNKIIRASSFDELVARLEAKTRVDAQASSGDPAKSNSP
ncbi:MAG: ABC transporter substrate-binding protein [Candidatus Rokubacteria bacterium]|nr:ABC transporter substrate-binding protein [Candidatus Rokubacteria bacterium]